MTKKKTKCRKTKLTVKPVKAYRKQTEDSIKHITESVKTTTTSEVGIYEAKTNFAHYIQRVASGNSFIITKHGHPIAELRPIVFASRTRNKNAVSALMKMSIGRTTITNEELKKRINKGRD